MGRSRKEIVLGVVGWQTLSKTPWVVYPSQNVNEFFQKGNFLGVVGWQTLSKIP